MIQNWKKIEELFHQAASLPLEERGAFLAGASDDDPATRREVEQLLAAEGTGQNLPGPFLPADLGAGKMIGRFEIAGICGAGAGGPVYLARDPNSQRLVAIKVFPQALTPEQRRRQLKEVLAMSVMRHPNIVAVEETGRSGDREFLVMQYIEGSTLGELITPGGLALDQALALATMIVEALDAAHKGGFLHRDLKPSNVMVTREGAVKLLDFGLAKALTPGPLNATLSTATGLIVGTPCYLSPEQARGEPVDARTDMFSFGVVLYEMLTGERPFDRGSLAGTLSAILRDVPVPVRKLRAGTPRMALRIVERCLQKNRDDRFGSAAELLKAICSCREKLARRRNPLIAVLLRPRMRAAVAALLAAVGIAAHRQIQIHNVRTVVQPRIAQFLSAHQYNAADELVRSIENITPRDRAVVDFARDYRVVTSVITTPPGAEVAIKDYTLPGAAWRTIGRAPLEKITVPLGYLRWRVGAPGHRTREFAETAVLQPTIRFGLYPNAGEPADMETIPEGPTRQPFSVRVPAFLLDRLEVTNRQYQDFVNAGGYARREYWREPLLLDERIVPWEQALARFQDQTGRPGPAGWTLGQFPEGRADFPVTGVSWYEAAAYGQYAGKRLPTYPEWLRAAQTEWLYVDTILWSNFSGKGLAPAGSYRGMDRFGTYDLVGNCKEWLWNASGPGNRLTMGGAWDEAYYAARMRDAAPEWDRRENLGFRCARSKEAPPAQFLEPVRNRIVRDYGREKPVGDAEFRTLRAGYDYTCGPLQTRVEDNDESNPYWRREKVTFEAAYEGPRVAAYLFLPRGGKEPYQTVVYFPSGIGYLETSSERMEMWFVEPLIRSGRAVLYPILWGMYDRKPGKRPPTEPRRLREVLDVRRSVDYVETRADLDPGKLAYFGFSAGATAGPVVLAVEPRFKVAELAVVGLDQAQLRPVDDPFQFAPRVRIPVLLVNGRYDLSWSPEVSVQPLLNILGSANSDKKLVLLEAGHAMIGIPAGIREMLGWLDRYLGPVPMARTKP